MKKFIFIFLLILLNELFSQINYILDTTNIFTKTQQLGIYSTNIYNDSLLFTLGGDGSLYVHNITNKLLYKITNIHLGAILTNILIPQKPFLITGGWDGSIKLFDFKNQKIIKLYNNTKSITNLKFVPEFNLIFLSSEDKTIKIFKLSFADTTLKLLNIVENQNLPSDFITVIGNDPKFVNVINNLYGCELQFYNKSAELEKISYYDFSLTSTCNLNDTTIIFGDEIGKINFYDINRHSFTKSIQLHTNKIIKLVKEDNFLISAGWDNRVIVYDINNDKIIYDIKITNSWISDLLYSSKKIFISTLDSKVYLFKLPN
jgi:WD40 repeat protein